MEITKELLLQHFPFTPRGKQEWLIEQLVPVLNDTDKQFVVIQAPTGSGKSAFAMMLAETFGSAYILTANKFLQDQYLRDFEAHMADIRGRANYECSHKIKKRGSEGFMTFNCANAPCRDNPQSRKQCSIKKACGYHKALEKAVEHPITSFNFAAALAYFNFTPYFDTRDLLIIDEAHLVENQMTGFIGFSISETQIDKYMIPRFKNEWDSVYDFIPWLKECSKKLMDYYDAGAPPGDAKWDEFENFMKKVINLSKEIAAKPENFILTKQLLKGEILEKVTFNPLDVSDHTEEKLFRMADEKVIMLSATIVNPDSFARDLGIPIDKMAFIDVPSTFPIANRRIMDVNVGRINYKNMSEKLPQIVDIVNDLMEDHKDEKGIIFASSYKICNYIAENLPEKQRNRLIYPKNSAEQVDLLQKHADSEVPTVLISPSMAEGVDLKDDLSRFQILTKAMFPSLGDKLVAARMKSRKGWYETQTLLKIIQAYGRSIRSETDTATTYIVDESIYNLIDRFAHKLPSYFIEAVYGEEENEQT